MKLKETESLSEQDQQELDDIAEKIFDIEEQIENFGKKEQPSNTDKEQPSNVDKEQKQAIAREVVVLKIQIGNRFDTDTGKEINPPFEQTFTRSEWNNFKQFHKNCGYRITEVVNDPWNEAAEYVKKIK